MDQSIRNKLRNIVTQCRKLLEDAVAQVLQGQFGIYATGKKDEVHVDDDAKMKHLSAEDRTYRKDILDHFEHVKALGYKPTDSLAQLVREVAFTHLNRFCAYKMMEARSLIRESVSKGLKSQGFLFYLADHEDDENRANSGQQDVAYRHFLNWLGGTLSEEIGVLFNPHDSANRLYPPQRVLDDVLNLLNDEAIADIWTQDETIGWVYQYFTPKELRDQVRKESQAPRNSYELAFRNQFFTPRYVVEFLTDNTLGRIWYEMRKGDTKLRDQCRYMVRRPTEMFLKDGKQPPKDAVEGRDDLSQEELLKLPVHIPHRPKKDPRELKILDPACGSGHFLLYCFDLLLTIYEEAYSDSELGTALQQDYPTLDALERDVPRLILAHNLHGIDIDLRASQIAALALWLRCQRAFQEMGLKKNRPKITRSNFVCAEPMPGEQQMLNEFVGQLEPKVLGQVVEVVFDKMKLAGEAGSLLKIEEEIRDAVAAAKRQYVRETTQAKDRKGQPLLFTQAVMDRIAGKPEQPSLFDLSDITEDQFFEQAEARVIEALRSYAEKAQNDQRLQRRLFSEDAVQGFAFVDLCQRHFDVVLMNPPFGEVSLPSRKYLYATIPSSTQDVFAAFIARWTHSLRPLGRLGSITSRLGLFKDLLNDWRTEFFLGEASQLRELADLGYDVLDEALVEASAYVVERKSISEGTTPTLFMTALDRTEKQPVLLNTIGRLNEGHPSDRAFWHSPEVFAKLPKQRIPYWCSDGWLARFSRLPPLSDMGIIAKKGLETGKDFEQLRLFWEVAAPTLKSFERWTPYSKGGQYCPFHADLHLTFDWQQSNTARRTSNSELYGKAGLTYTERTTSSFAARILPSHSLFSPAGPAVIDSLSVEPWGLLGFLNSSAVSFYFELLVGGGDTSAAGTAARHFMPSLVEMLPAPPEFRKLLKTIHDHCKAIHDNLLPHRLDETSWQFSAPVFDGKSLKECVSRKWSRYESAVLKALDSFQILDTAVMEAYQLSEEERHDLKTFLGRPLPTGQTVDDQDVQLVLDWFGQNLSDQNDDAEEGEAKIQSRALKKLCYVADQRYETVSVLADVSPRTIAQLRSKFGLIPPMDLLRETQGTLSYSVGCGFGRWDIRKATNADIKTESTFSFGSLPAFQPGALSDTDSRQTTLLPDEYPLNISRDGILIDDPEHQDDLVRHVRDAFEVVWKEGADLIEQEACEILGVKELREYFRKPGKGGFWDDHISRYSKSRRNAPIYWLLQSLKKNYAIWFYYHRLDKDMLFKALVNYVEPKIRLEGSRLDSLRSQKSAAEESGTATKKSDKEIEKQEDLISELKDFEDKLRRAADLHLEPDLNDGVVLNIAPLHELVPWKDAKSYWNELLEGKYEWSSIGKQLRQKGIVK